MMLEKLRNFYTKKSIQNGIWLYLLQFFNTIIPLITLPYVTRILGASRYGMFSSAFNVVGYLQVVVEYGFAMSATREVALNHTKSQIDKLFSTILYSRFLLFILSVCFSIIYLIFWQPNIIQMMCYWLLAIMLLATTLQENWLFQGLEDMKYIAITSIIARTITMFLIFLCVKSINDLLSYCLLYAISPLISNILGLYIAKKKYNIKLIKVKLKDISDELKKGWYIFTTQFTSKVFGAIGVTFLTFFSSSSTVGVFSAIQKIPNVMILIWTPISTILYPIASKRMRGSFDEGKKYILHLRKYLLLIFLIPIILFSVFSQLIVKISFGNSYASKSYWLIPLLLWVFIAIDNNFWGIQILLGSGHDKEYSFCFMISVIATIIFNFVFIKLWGGTGAAWAPFASELLLDILLIHQVRKIKKS